MAIKWVTLGCSLSLLITGLTWQAVKAQTPTDCGSKLINGATYKTYHQGPSLAFTGGIQITRTFACAKGTCFSANMTFDNSGGTVDRAEGFWKGSNIEFVRQSAIQVWSGQCLANSVRGQWYYASAPDNSGLFSITY